MSGYQQINPLYAHLPKHRDDVASSCVYQGCLALGRADEYCVTLADVQKCHKENRVGGEGSRSRRGLW